MRKMRQRRTVGILYNCLITVRSVTHAQRAARLLQANGCFSITTRPPQELTGNQCAYAIKLPCECLHIALSLFTQYSIPFQRVYRRVGGQYEVVDFS